MMISSEQDTVGDVSSCGVSSDTLQNVPCPYVVPRLPDPEPWALLFNYIHPLDML